MSTRADNTVQEPLPSLLNECLEVNVNSARINALAAWRPDTGEQFTTRNGPPDAGGLSRLDLMAQGARFVLGHNLIAFDIPHLQAADPGLRLLKLPRLDTLLLNPLAFPRRPYHRLVISLVVTLAVTNRSWRLTFTILSLAVPTIVIVNPESKEHSDTEHALVTASAPPEDQEGYRIPPSRPPQLLG